MRSSVPLAQPLTLPPFQMPTEPYTGSSHSMAAMKRMALAGERSPDVRAWALTVVRQVTPKDYMSEAAALYYDVCARIRYTRDPAHTELINHPSVTLAQRAGDCDDQADLIRAGLGALLGALGNAVEFAAVGFRPPQTAYRDPYSHVFIRVRDPKSGEWAILDPVAGPRTAAMVAKVQTLKSVVV
jgi:hypothetical protein